MPRARQKMIPGTEPPSIPALDRAADAYVEVRDARMSLQKRENEAHDNVLALMLDHKLTSYDYEGFEAAAYIMTNK